MLNSSAAHATSQNAETVSDQTPKSGGNIIGVEVLQISNVSSDMRISNGENTIGSGMASAIPPSSIAGQGLGQEPCSLSTDDVKNKQEANLVNEENQPQMSPTATSAGSKEKSPMCLINELSRFNGIQHQYHLIDESGPPHKKLFTVVLKLGDEQYKESGYSIRKAQHSAAIKALNTTNLAHPPAKLSKKVIASNVPLTPTVQLNVLAMKRGQPAVYHVYEPSRPPQSIPPYGITGTTLYDFRGMYNQRYHFPRGFYQARVTIGDHQFLGKGKTAQAARHAAAEEALKELANIPLPENSDKEDENQIKSPISLIHEMALKRGLLVKFEVITESGPSHMPSFVTKCTVGQFLTEGEGSSKKFSKKKAAELMLENMKTLPPLPPAEESLEVVQKINRKIRFPKKKRSSNLIKNRPNIGKVENDGLLADKNEPLGSLIEKVKSLDISKTDKIYEEDNRMIHPVSRLIQLQQARKEREPQFRVTAEKSIDKKKKEFTIECWITNSKSYPNKSGTSSTNMTSLGVGNTKKEAKKKSAEAMLHLLGYSKETKTTESKPEESLLSTHSILKIDTQNEQEVTESNQGQKVRKVQFVHLEQEDNEAGPVKYMLLGEKMSGNKIGRQLAPGLLLMPTDESSLSGNILGHVQSIENSEPTISCNDNPDSQVLKIASIIASELLESGSSATGIKILSQRKYPHPKEGISNHLTNPTLQLQYLESVLYSSFQVHFSDFPKKNKPDFLTVVTITTNPPKVSHGVGNTVESARDAASHNALKQLAKHTAEKD